MNEIQEKLLSIFKCFAKICEKHNLKYYAVGGTMLGAVRHRGFIPWDNDMDIIMPRPDYETFLTIAPSELPDNLFLQCHYTENKWYHPFSKIRDSNTTAIEKEFLNSDINNGLWIDIFPIDNRVASKAKNIVNDFVYRILMRRLMCSYKIKRNLLGKIKSILLIIMLPSKEFCWKKMNNTLTKYNNIDGCKYFRSPWDLRPAYKYLYPYEWIRELINVKFEDTYIKIPIDYDKYLSYVFGNYMELPPLEKRTSGSHNITILDTKRSYKDIKKTI